MGIVYRSAFRLADDLRKEDAMTDVVQHSCTRPWWMRPPVWFIGVVLVLLVVFAIVEMAGRPAAIPYGAFLDQLDAGNVATVTFQGTQIEGRFKHPVGVTGSGGTEQRDVFRSRIPDFGDQTLLPELRKQHVAIDVASSSQWTSWLGRLPWPMFVFLGAIVIAGLVRLARGGKAQSGATVPMHPMQGVFGLVSGLFAKHDRLATPSGHPGGETKSG
jgi:ATP-dependent Zn protease